MNNLGNHSRIVSAGVGFGELLYVKISLKDCVRLGHSAVRCLQVPVSMKDPEELDLLRIAYEQALASYETACSALNLQLLAGKQPSPRDLQREQDARAALATA